MKRIVAVALKVEGIIVTSPPPARHHTLLHAVHNINRKLRIGPSGQGFITSEGEFVGREDALRIAIAAGQIEAGKYSNTELFSEDLW